jgi:hypothetical protein
MRTRKGADEGRMMPLSSICLVAIKRKGKEKFE